MDATESSGGMRLSGHTIPGALNQTTADHRAGAYRSPRCLTDWAARTAHRLLATELPQRWAHTQGVAAQAEQVATVLAPTERPVLIAAAWLHDIGYAPDLIDTGFHPLDGARFLRNRGVPDRVCAMVAHHSGAAAVATLLGLTDQLAHYRDERTPVRDALWYCDMTTRPDRAARISFAEGIAEIRTRRNPDDPIVRALAVSEHDRAAAVQRTQTLIDAAKRS